MRKFEVAVGAIPRWWADGYLPTDYLIALGEARSCLAALADSAADVDLSAHFDRLLIQLDFITGDIGPACSPTVGTSTELLARLEGAIDEMLDRGGADGLSLELVPDAAMNPVGRLEGRTPQTAGRPTRRFCRTSLSDFGRR